MSDLQHAQCRSQPGYFRAFANSRRRGKEPKGENLLSVPATSNPPIRRKPCGCAGRKAAMNKVVPGSGDRVSRVTHLKNNAESRIERLEHRSETRETGYSVTYNHNNEKVTMGRKPTGERAMTNAERQAKYREQRRPKTPEQAMRLEILNLFRVYQQIYGTKAVAAEFEEAATAIRVDEYHAGSADETDWVTDYLNSGPSRYDGETNATLPRLDRN